MVNVGVPYLRKQPFTPPPRHDVFSLAGCPGRQRLLLRRVLAWFVCVDRNTHMGDHVCLRSLRITSRENVERRIHKKFNPPSENEEK